MIKKMAGILCIVSLLVFSAYAQTWTNISSSLIQQLGTQPSPAGTGGVGVNRLTGDVFLNVVGFGIWKSTNQGATWNLYTNVVNQRCENGWGFQIDQNDPKRMANFTIDGTAASTLDGVNWRAMASVWGRNWDYGSADWTSPGVNVMLAGAHESGGVVYKTIDAGLHWTAMNISVNPVTNMEVCMIGVIDSTTFIYCFGSGIQRSVDQGNTWTKVSDVNPSSKIPVYFKGKYYLCTAAGMLVSSDKGATWQTQGSSAVSLYLGPYFGSDENTMVAVGSQGVYKTINAGSSWSKIAEIPPNSGDNYDPHWYACFSWDPINNVLYAARMANPGYKCALPSEAFNFTGGIATPSIVVNNAATQVQFSAGVVALQGSVTGVTIDLSSLGGGSAVPMQNTTGSNYQASYTIAAGAVAGEKAMVITATSSTGATAHLNVTLTIADASAPILVSKNKTVVASSTQSTDLSADKAVDGDMSSRWSSLSSDPQWIYVDLGSVMPVSKVVLYWEAAYGKSYKIQVSDDTTTWTDVFSTTTGDGGTDQINFAPANGRYVRVYATARGTAWGYSLYEFEVYSPPATVAVPKLTTGYVKETSFGLRPTSQGITVCANASRNWTLSLFAIDGRQLIRRAGVGTITLMLDAEQTKGAVVARLESEGFKTAQVLSLH